MIDHCIGISMYAFCLFRSVAVVQDTEYVMLRLLMYNVSMYIFTKVKRLNSAALPL